MSSNASKAFGTLLTFGLVGMGLMFMVGMSEEARSAHDPTPVFGIVAGAAIFVFLLRGPVGRAIGRMLEGPAQLDDGLRDRVEQLEAQVADSLFAQQHIQELEERVDFAERLLAQRGALPAHDRVDTPV